MAFTQPSLAKEESEEGIIVIIAAISIQSLIRMLYERLLCYYS